MKRNSVPVLAAALSLTWLLSATPANAASPPATVPTEVTEALNAVSKALTLDELIDLNRKAAGPDKPDAAKLAEDWAKEYKLA